MGNKLSFVLTGTRALIMHRDNIEFGDELERARAALPPGISKKGDDRSPAWSWLGCLYHDGERLAIDQCNFMTCLRQAGATMPIPGARNGKTYKEATQSGLLIDQEYLDFLAAGKPVPLAPLLKLRDAGDSRDVFPEHQKTASKFGFELYVKRAKVGQGKHVRVRPRFPVWTVSGTLEVLDLEVLNLEVLRDIFDAAGRKGLGDWRPGGKTPGPFGQFTAKLSASK